MLVAGERGGALARTVFMGLGDRRVWKSLSWIFQVFRTAIGYTVARTSFFPNATLNLDISPEYMGVGYVIGPRIAGVMFAGGVLSWLGAAPAPEILGNYMTVRSRPCPASGLRIDQMSAQQMWSAYIRYTGAGAVLAAGLITLGRTIPTIIVVVPREHQGFRRAARPARRGCAPSATCRSWSCSVGSLLLALFLAVTPRHADAVELPRRDPHRRLRLLLRHRLVADHRAHRHLVEPDLGHDDRDADPDVLHLRRRRLDSATCTRRSRSCVGAVVCIAAAIAGARRRI